MEKTLVHEDVFVYVDPIEEISDVKNGTTNFDFESVTVGEIADLGVFVIEVVSGSYTKAVISAGGKAATFNVPFGVGNRLVLDFRNLHFAKDSTMIFTDDIPLINDDEQSSINVTLTGDGTANVTRLYEKVSLGNNDVLFIESLSVDTSIERIKKTLYNGKEKNIKSEKKVHSFSINGLWNQEEVSKFTEKFRLRVVDKDWYAIKILASCVINSNGISSSSGGGDLTYSISGSCEKIFN